MRPLSGKEFIKLAERNGWKLLRIAGSHHILGKDGSIVRLSVPVHGNRLLKIGLQQKLLKLADLAEDGAE